MVYSDVSLTWSALRFDPGILRSTVGSSVKLFSLCGRWTSPRDCSNLRHLNVGYELFCLCAAIVVWLQKTGKLPAATPSVLSQVAFQLLIPCFLMSKVIIGAALGKVACWLAYPRQSQPANISTTPTWVPAVAEAVALAPVAASGQQGPAVEPKQELVNTKLPLELVAAAPPSLAPSDESKRGAVVTAACAFGNSLTLPLVYLTGVLTDVEADRAAGYLALFMVGWSPALWSVGYRIITGGGAGEDEDLVEEGGELTFLSPWQSVVAWLSRVMNPPLYGVLIGMLIGGTPLSHLFVAAPHDKNGTAGESLTSGVLALLFRSTAGIFRPVLEAVTVLGSATLAVQTIVLASSLAASVPLELRLPRSLKAPAFRMLKQLRWHTSKGDGGIIQEAFEPLKGRSMEEARLGGANSKPPLLDSKSLIVITVVRLVAMPIVGLLMTLALRQGKFIPADPVCSLVLLVEATMPSAQNLVLLSQLRASTRPLAGVLANLMLRQYVLSVVPITLWMTLFVSLLPR
eukprot:SM000103S09479  [mRNA]  locus=s103:177162:180399:- [translate_table: standard]